MSKRNSILSILLTISGLLFVAFIGFAQTQTPAPAPQFSRVQIVKLNPGMSDDWRKYYQTEIVPALKKAGVKQHSVWRVTQGDVRQYVIVSPLESMAQMDEPNAMVKALGQEAAQSLITKQSRFFAEWHTYILVGRPDLSIPSTLTDAPKLGLAVKSTITPGRVAEWVKGVKENALPIAQKAGVKGMLTGQVVLGGNPNEFRSLLFFDSYADIAKFQAAYGKTAAEMKLAPSTPAGVVAEAEFLVARYVPELSIRPEPQKAAN